MTQFTFHDYHSATQSLHDAVLHGFSLKQKAIPPKFFYDERGSALFEAICHQPEYYPPTVERALLTSIRGEIAELVGEGRVLIEPGAGSAEKVRILLDALRPSAYVPMDISRDFLKEAARGVVVECPWLPVHAACVDYTHSLPVPEPVPAGDRLIFFPGSSLGNFEPDDAQAFMRLCCRTAGSNGMMLIGVDTKKDHRILHAAYNDAAGVTADFNRNLLHRIRQELDADCKPEHFEHQAFYNAEDGRVEMHLVSRCSHAVHVNGHAFEFDEGETLHTECSYKYRPDEFIELAVNTGFEPVRHWQDPDQLFAVYLLQTRRMRV